MKVKKLFSYLILGILSLNLCCVNAFDRRSGTGKDGTPPPICWACCLSQLLRNAGYRDISTNYILDNVEREEKWESNPGEYGPWVDDTFDNIECNAMLLEDASTKEILENLDEQEIGWGKLVGDCVIVNWISEYGEGHSTLMYVKRRSRGSGFEFVKLENPYVGTSTRTQFWGNKPIKVTGLRGLSTVFEIVWFTYS